MDKNSRIQQHPLPHVRLPQPTHYCRDLLLILNFASHLTRLLIIPQRHKPRMPQMIVWSPFPEFELPDQNRLEPQCRMPNYAECVFGDEILKASTRGCASMAPIVIRHSPGR